MVFNWHHRRDRHPENDTSQTVTDILVTPRHRLDRHPESDPSQTMTDTLKMTHHRP